MVKSRQIYSPQNFVEAVTGRCYILREDDVVKEIHDLLRWNKVETKKKPLCDYPLDAIAEIVDNDVDVVLVDCTYIGDDFEMKHEFRWFEVPKNFKEEE